MNVQLPKLPKGAFWAAAALTVYGINRGASDVARGAGDLAGDIGDTVQGAANVARRKWEKAGEGTRAALPLVVIFGGLILWKGRR